MNHSFAFRLVFGWQDVEKGEFGRPNVRLVILKTVPLVAGNWRPTPCGCRVAEIRDWSTGHFDWRVLSPTEQMATVIVSFPDEEASSIEETCDE